MMAFGYRVTTTGAFAEAARLYNPKLFEALKAQVATVNLMPTPKAHIDQFATNFEHILGDVEGTRNPMRTDSHVFSQEMAETSAA
jgi:hypothetical protein